MKLKDERIFTLVAIALISFFGWYALACPDPFTNSKIIGDCIFQERLLRIDYFKFCGTYTLVVDLTLAYMFYLFYRIFMSSTTKIICGLGFIFMLGYSILDISSLFSITGFYDLVHSKVIEIAYGIFSISILVTALFMKR